MTLLLLQELSAPEVKEPAEPAMVWILDGTGEEAKPTLTYLLDRIMENAPPDDSPNADCRSDPDDMQYAWYHPDQIPEFPYRTVDRC